MHDLRWLRENAAAFDRSLARRGLPPAAATILAVDEERRALETRLQEGQAERNRLSREIGERKRAGGDARELLDRVAALKDEVKAGEERLRELQARLESLLASYPAVLAEDVPDGPDERANRVVRVVGTPRRFAFAPKPHDELGARLGMSFEKAAKLSGARFVVLTGGLARLERAIAAFMLDLQTREHGYTEVAPPYLVRDEALFGTGQLPKFAQDLFRTDSGHWLIPTAEVPLTNLVAGEILAESQLPLRFVACTPCFRSEAGAAGKDTRGMIRQHQFTKVELVSVTTPEQSAAEHERMTRCAEEVLKRLELPYRVVLLCSGDTGFASTKTYDLEVWLPGQGVYREISSCSNCGDFQARRMQARFRPEGGKPPRFVHTLNGSGLAVGRTLIAVLENFQEEDGSIRLPGALVPYMDGIDRLEPEGR
ncbi:MAG: serine--tRNA ligase [Geminicoccaceae bacterium]|nr:serine--tRNA ligase [Geminicoccaceae bacterium]MCX8101674.1 serine--tRNA ligase [Geminicoccaceae bacterium]MDW8371742.1 serine--tRNA ligase [Geminicoccaceae bacterium]